MKQRDIISLMHRLHYGDIDSTDGYMHLMKGDQLDRSKFEQFIRRYIPQENLLLYANSQNVLRGSLQDGFEFTRKYMSENRIRIANEDFSAKIIVEPTGVAVGHLTRP